MAGFKRYRLSGGASHNTHRCRKGKSLLQMRWKTLVGAIGILFFFMWFVHPPNVRAATYSLLHSFDGGNGEYPTDSLVTDGTYLYGVTSSGGTSAQGVIFRIDTDGQNYTVLHTFLDGSTPNDGQVPVGSLIISGSTLYGMTEAGGSAQNGTVFKIDTDGANYAIIHSFGDGSITNDGNSPQGTLLLSGATLYGVTAFGGAAGNGTIFSMDIAGNNGAILHSFLDGAVANDGAQPEGGTLTLSGSTLYGMTTAGGYQYPPGFGVIYKINTDGSNYAILHFFRDGSVPNDGYEPYNGKLVLSGSTLYGMTSAGGAAFQGTVFKIDTDGNNYAILHSFGDGSVANDGGSPWGSLILSGSTLYGMTKAGGAAGVGTIFEISTSGGIDTILHSFADGSVTDDANTPEGSLIFLGATLYGMSYGGGSYGTNLGIGGLGTIFSLAGAVSPAAPSASFNATSTSGAAPLTVDFTDTSTGPPTGWSWSFGNGTTSSSPDPSHSFTQPGSYTVTLTVTNSAGSSYSYQTFSVSSSGNLWQNATPTGNGWYYLAPFGAFNTNASPWIYHLPLGWLYPFGTSTNSIWFYDPNWDGVGGWWWSSSSAFPWIYSNSEQGWYYYDAKDSSPGARWFCNPSGCAEH